jgi:hypothetical protein
MVSSDRQLPALPPSSASAELCYRQTTSRARSPAPVGTRAICKEEVAGSRPAGSIREAASRYCQLLPERGCRWSSRDIATGRERRYSLATRAGRGGLNSICKQEGAGSIPAGSIFCTDRRARRRGSHRRARVSPSSSCRSNASPSWKPQLRKPRHCARAFPAVTRLLAMSTPSPSARAEWTGLIAGAKRDAKYN